MLRVGLVGLGKMGMSHAAILNSLKNIKFCGAAETSRFLRWGFNKYSNFSIFNDFQDLEKKNNLDAVVIATPTASHYKIAKYFLKKKIHVFLEKPCCLNFKETCELEDISIRNNLVVQIGYHNRYLNTFNMTRDIIKEARIGKIKSFKSESYGPVVLKKGSSSWRTNRKKGGGCLYDYASHVINLTEYLLGDIKSVEDTELRVIHSKNAEDEVYSKLILQNGLIGDLSVSWSKENFRKMSTSIKINTEKAVVYADSTKLDIFHNNEDKKNTYYLTDNYEPVEYYLRGEEYSNQIIDFIKNIKTKNFYSRNSINKSKNTDKVIQMLISDDENNQKARSNIFRRVKRFLKKNG